MRLMFGVYCHPTHVIIISYYYRPAPRDLVLPNSCNDTKISFQSIHLTKPQVFDQFYVYAHVKLKGECTWLKLYERAISNGQAYSFN